ncbi:MAG: hypothetical protein AB7Q17_15755 [Phycisphaerae bacterium]
MAEKLVEVVIAARNKVEDGTRAAERTLNDFRARAARQSVIGDGGFERFAGGAVKAATAIAGFKAASAGLVPLAHALRGEWTQAADALERIPIIGHELVTFSNLWRDVAAGEEERAEAHAERMRELQRARTLDIAKTIAAGRESAANLEREARLAATVNDFERERLALQFRLSDLAEKRAAAARKGVPAAELRRMSDAEQTIGVVGMQQIAAREREAIAETARKARQEQAEAANQREAALRDQLQQQSDTESLAAELAAARMEEVGRELEAQQIRIVERYRRAREDVNAEQRAILDELERGELAKTLRGSAGERPARPSVEAVVVDERFRGLAASTTADSLPRAIREQTKDLRDAVERIRQTIVELSRRPPQQRGFAL